MAEARRWYCYVCGKDVQGIFCLCGYPNIDRVFLCHMECTDQLEDIVITSIVTEAGGNESNAAHH